MSRFILLIALVLAGCSISAGDRLCFNHDQRTDMPAGIYQMNCVWEKVEWETAFGGLYLNCEESKIDKAQQ